jgi:acylphosphatase
MDERQVRVVIAGRVQGVGFRMSCRQQALREGVTGWVRNRSDDSVEALFVGPSPAVERMVQWCWLGPVAARVESVVVTEAPDEKHPAMFSIR